jgi:hypothetical protein
MPDLRARELSEDFIDPRSGKKVTIQYRDTPAARKRLNSQIDKLGLIPIASGRQMAARAPTPTATPAPQQRSQGNPLVPRSIENLRGPFVMAGAGLGGALAAPGVVTTPLGATLGAAGGQVAFDLAAQLGRQTGLVGPQGILQDAPDVGGTGGLGRVSQRALSEAALEAGTGGVASAARPLARSAFQRIAGVDQPGRRLAAAAQRLAGPELPEGVEIGIERVSRRTSIQGFRKVVGRFPFVGSPLRTADEKISKQLGVALQHRLNSLGPSVSTAEMGVKLNSAANRKFRAVKKIISAQYDDVFALADDSGARIRPDNLREESTALVAGMTSRRPRMIVETLQPDGSIIQEYKEIPKPIKGPILAFARKLQNIEDTITLRQYQELSQDLSDIMEMSRTKGFPLKKTVELKKALEEDIVNIDVPEVREAFQAANRKFATLMRLVEGPTAKKFTRVDKRIFGVGFERGTINEDELFGAVFNASSPRAISDLRKLVGPKVFRRAVRVHMDEALALALERSGSGDFLNMQVFRNNLGLNAGNPAGRATLAVALRGTGVSVDQIDDFFDVLDAAVKSGTIDPSTFVSRRAVLGGLRSATRAVFPAAAFAGAGPPKTFSGTIGQAIGGLGAVFGLHKASSILTSPRALRAATEVLRPIPQGGFAGVVTGATSSAERVAARQAAAIANKRAAAVRLLRLLPQEALTFQGSPQGSEQRGTRQ